MDSREDSPNSPEEHHQSEPADSQPAASPEVPAAGAMDSANLMAAVLGQTRHGYYPGFGYGGLDPLVFTSGNVNSLRHAEALQRLNTQVGVLLAQKEALEKKLQDHEPGIQEKLKEKDRQLIEVQNRLK